MKDIEAWDRAVNAARGEFATFSGAFLERIGFLAGGIKRHKAALYELTKSVEGGLACEVCRGGCCHSGKYHFTVIDLLVYLSDAKELFTPDFSNKRCPYLALTGCMMEPEYRPFNCITFHCDRIEQLLHESDLRSFYAMEKDLRIQCAEVEKLFDNTFACGLLANFEKKCNSSGRILFRQ